MNNLTKSTLESQPTLPDKKSVPPLPNGAPLNADVLSRTFRKIEEEDQCALNPPTRSGATVPRVTSSSPSSSPTIKPTHCEEPHDDYCVNGTWNYDECNCDCYPGWLTNPDGKCTRIESPTSSPTPEIKEPKFPTEAPVIVVNFTVSFRTSEEEDTEEIDTDGEEITSPASVPATDIDNSSR